MTRKSVLHVYARISDPSQRKGGGLTRQTTADVETFAREYDFVVNRRVLVDDGVSAWKGLNASKDHELGKFLQDAERGLIPPGDCLAIENYDRLSRQDPWAAIGLVNELRQRQIHIGRLDRMKLLRHDSKDAGDFFEASVEFMRGNSESNAKSERNGAAWKRKRKAARESGKAFGKKLPGWLELVDGKVQVVPTKAAVVVRMFEMAAAGLGTHQIVGTFCREKVPPVAYKATTWTKPFVRRTLRGRAVLGEFQPKGAGRKPDGDPAKGYFPAVIDEDLWNKVQGAIATRRTPGNRGRDTGKVNVFRGLLFDALDGGSYTLWPRRIGGKNVWGVVSKHGRDGSGGSLRTFPYETLERAVLSLLREIDPKEVMNGHASDDAVLVLTGRLGRVEAEIAEAAAFMGEHGFSPTIGKRVTELESRKRDLAAELALARQKAAHPLSESWGETRTLLDTLDAAADPAEARTRLRAAMQRIIDRIDMVVVPRGVVRLAALQVTFAGGDKYRDYLVIHKGAKGNRWQGSVTLGGWSVCSFEDAFGDKNPWHLAAELDLRRRQDAVALERRLGDLDLEKLG
jgi:DNA invertase Pin-like site-specific DNA recombinase